MRHVLRNIPLKKWLMCCVSSNHHMSKLELYKAEIIPWDNGVSRRHTVHGRIRASNRLD